jgi:hypothetical protein
MRVPQLYVPLTIVGEERLATVFGEHVNMAELYSSNPAGFAEILARVVDVHLAIADDGVSYQMTLPEVAVGAILPDLPFQQGHVVPEDPPAANGAANFDEHEQLIDDEAIEDST